MLSGEKTLLALVVAILVFLLFAWIVQLAYNATMPKLVPGGAPEMDYRTAVIFCILVVVVGSLFSPHSMVTMPINVEKLDQTYGYSNVGVRSVDQVAGSPWVGVNF